MLQTQTDMPAHFISRFVLLISGLALMAFGVVAVYTFKLRNITYFICALQLLFYVGKIDRNTDCSDRYSHDCAAHNFAGKKIQWLQLLDRQPEVWITQNWNIHHYALQMATCLFSGLMTAAGVCLIIKANSVFLAGEGLHATVSQRFDANFGSCKTYGDIVLVSIAMISS